MAKGFADKVVIKSRKQSQTKKTVKRSISGGKTAAPRKSAKTGQAGKKAAKKPPAINRGRPKKNIKYTKTVNVRLTQHQWAQVITWSEKAHLEPSVYIRKVLLDFLNITPEER